MMPNKSILLIGLLLILGGCIKPYYPKFNEDSIQKWVVEGMISNQEGWQEVRISISSSYFIAEFVGVEDCEVEIWDDLNQKFTLEEVNKGIYRVWMSQEYLVPGRSYKLHVKTSDGNILESTFDQMPVGPEISDTYFEIKDLPTSEPDEWLSGIQFYTDLNAGEDDSRYYRWRVTETWEYESAYPKEYYYDGEIQRYVPPDSSQYYCWDTEQIDEVFTITTENLSENTFTKIPLHFVSSKTDQLSKLYSIFVEQIALSEEAFVYWDQLRKNISVGEGLYASQPLAIKGNISNVNNPDQSILGFFQASSISSKRFFVESVEGLELDFSNSCSPAVLRKGLLEIKPRDYPAYLMTSESGNWLPIIFNYECVDCTLRGGSTEKPDFWPW